MAMNQRRDAKLNVISETNCRQWKLVCQEFNEFGEQVGEDLFSLNKHVYFSVQTC